MTKEEIYQKRNDAIGVVYAECDATIEQIRAEGYEKEQQAHDKMVAAVQEINQRTDEALANATQ